MKKSAITKFILTVCAATAFSVTPFISAAEKAGDENIQNLQQLLQERAEQSPGSHGEEIKDSLTAKGEIKGIQEMPIVKMFFVEAQQGTYLISGDGRFVFEGVLKDVWHRKTIKNLEDARSTERLPLSNIGFKPEEQLASFTLGNPNIPRQGVIFVDPTSDITVIALQEIMKDPKNTHWVAVLMPLIGGNNAVDRSRKLWCATDRELAKSDLINGTSKSLSSIDKSCSEDPLIMGMMLTDLLQIRSLPHLIREDGLKSSGFPENFKGWYSQP